MVTAQLSVTTPFMMFQYYKKHLSTDCGTGVSIVKISRHLSSIDCDFELSLNTDDKLNHFSNILILLIARYIPAIEIYLGKHNLK